MIELVLGNQLPVDFGKIQDYKDIHKEKMERAVLPSDSATVDILKPSDR